jgi:hypothetical protein
MERRWRVTKAWQRGEGECRGEGVGAASDMGRFAHAPKSKTHHRGHWEGRVVAEAVVAERLGEGGRR